MNRILHYENLKFWWLGKLQNPSTLVERKNGANPPSNPHEYPNHPLTYPTALIAQWSQQWSPLLVLHSQVKAIADGCCEKSTPESKHHCKKQEKSAAKSSGVANEKEVMGAGPEQFPHFGRSSFPIHIGRSVVYPISSTITSDGSGYLCVMGCQMSLRTATDFTLGHARTPFTNHIPIWVWCTMLGTGVPAMPCCAMS